MGHQLSDSQRRVPPLFLSSLLSLSAVWDTHRFAPGESSGNPRGGEGRGGGQGRGMYLAAGSQGLTLGTQAGELVLTSPRPPSSSNNPVICVYYRRVAEGRDKSSLFQTCSGAHISWGQDPEP
ncbi:unnamed protein product [Pleuronectes platessa]|uniref:Uncharacterized protein n=1 Tax=Pleuronectes platessa TaxID=8262 RepID=A0A9N7VCZ0_PLEPL|nr:unnamed protein product [Pleuronectes platessa]